MSAIFFKYLYLKQKHTKSCVYYNIDTNVVKNIHTDMMWWVVLGKIKNLPEHLPADFHTIFSFRWFLNEPPLNNS